MVGRTKDEEVLHQLERLLDHEVRALEEADDQFELLVVVDLAVLGGAIALIRSIVPAGMGGIALAPVAVVTLLVGFALASISFILLMQGYVGWVSGGGPRAQVGPNPDHLIRLSHAPEVSSADVRSGLILGYRAYVRGLEAVLREKARIRRHALYSAFLSLVVFMVGTVMVVGG